MSVFNITARDLVLFAGLYFAWFFIALLLWRTLQHRIRNPGLRASFFSILFAPTLCPVVREAAVLAPAWLCGLGMCVLAFNLRYFLQLVILPLVVLWVLYRIRDRRRGPRMDPNQMAGISAHDEADSA
jgi:hypothetical protein